MAADDGAGGAIEDDVADRDAAAAAVVVVDVERVAGVWAAGNDASSRSSRC